MPRAPSDFPSVEPGKNGLYTFDFALDMPTGATIVSVTWEVTIKPPGGVSPGFLADPAPWLNLSGNPSISGTTTTQRIVGLYDGNTYRVAATVTLSDSEQVELWNLLPCRSPH